MVVQVEILWLTGPEDIDFFSVVYKWNTLMQELLRRLNKLHSCEYPPGGCNGDFK